MAFIINVEPTQRRGTLQLSGTVTSPLVLRAMQTLYSDPAWRPEFDIVWDCRDVRELVFTEADVAQFTTAAAPATAVAGTGRRALVTSRDLDHMIASLLVVRTRHDGRDRRVFTTLEAAHTWLSSDPEATSGDGQMSPSPEM